MCENAAGHVIARTCALQADRSEATCLLQPGPRNDQKVWLRLEAALSLVVETGLTKHDYTVPSQKPA